ncbi:MAG: META domain-containing protein [Burkholderiaceae bacterium]
MTVRKLRSRGGVLRPRWRRPILAAVLAAAAAVSGCATDNGPSALLRGVGLEGIEWRVVEALGKPIAGLGSNRVVFQGGADRFIASVGCNRIIGTYHLHGDAVRIVPRRSTRMACGGSVGDAERRVVAAFGAATRHRLEGERLELIGGRTVLAVLQRR